MRLLDLIEGVNQGVVSKWLTAREGPEKIRIFGHNSDKIPCKIRQKCSRSSVFCTFCPLISVIQRQNGRRGVASPPICVRRLGWLSSKTSAPTSPVLGVGDGRWHKTLICSKECHLCTTKVWASKKRPWKKLRKIIPWKVNCWLVQSDHGRGVYCSVQRISNARAVL